MLYTGYIISAGIAFTTSQKIIKFTDKILHLDDCLDQITAEFIKDLNNLLTNNIFYAIFAVFFFGLMVEQNVKQFTLHISYNKFHRVRRIKTEGGSQNMDEYVAQTEPLKMYCIANTDGAHGGNIRIQLIYEDGSVHEIDLPWGNQLLPYAKGEVSSLPSSNNGVKPSVPGKNSNMIFLEL